MTLHTDGEEDFIREAPLCWAVLQGGETGLSSRQNKGTWALTAKEQGEGQGIIENYVKTSRPGAFMLDGPDRILAERRAGW